MHQEQASHGGRRGAWSLQGTSTTKVMERNKILISVHTFTIVALVANQCAELAKSAVMLHPPHSDVHVVVHVIDNRIQ